MLPLECVVRGYLAGSGWKDYKATGEICGQKLPAELKESEQLPEPLFTPTTKAHTGHDEPLDHEQAAALVGDERFEHLKRASIELYRFASEYAAKRGIILADTKLEFGVDEEGTIVLGDELFTPDSSRFWPANGYTPGRGQPSFDKQYVRDYAETLGWDKTPPGPDLPDKVVKGSRRRYLEAFERLTGVPFADYASNPQVVLG
jgi:phosphoribosylaminoimidazole-succinocarboxamide synthase